jgi:hypothetical protein
MPVDMDGNSPGGRRLSLVPFPRAGTVEGRPLDRILPGGEPHPPRRFRRRGSPGDPPPPAGY